MILGHILACTMLGIFTASAWWMVYRERTKRIANSKKKGSIILAIIMTLVLMATILL